MLSYLLSLPRHLDTGLHLGCGLLSLALAELVEPTPGLGEEILILAGESHLMCHRGGRVTIIPAGSPILFSTCVMSLYMLGIPDIWNTAGHGLPDSETWPTQDGC